MDAIEFDKALERFPNGLPQKKFEYDASDNILYEGIAPRGAATSDTTWVIKKYTTSGSNITAVQSSEYNVAWDDRATETYA